jgi:hypothetical protein
MAGKRDAAGIPADPRIGLAGSVEEGPEDDLRGVAAAQIPMPLQEAAVQDSLIFAARFVQQGTDVVVSPSSPAEPDGAPGSHGHKHADTYPVNARG